jgi:hypothetical protein
VLPEPGLVPLLAAGATIRFHTRAIPAGTPKNSEETNIRSSLTKFLAFLNTSAATDECNGKGHHLVLLTDPRFSYQVRRSGHASHSTRVRVTNARVCRCRWKTIM